MTASVTFCESIPTALPWERNVCYDARKNQDIITKFCQFMSRLLHNVYSYLEEGLASSAMPLYVDVVVMLNALISQAIKNPSSFRITEKSR